MPCGGDAYASSGAWIKPQCSVCNKRALWGKCLGSDGYRWLALAAAEVARERKTDIAYLLLWARP